MKVRFKRRLREGRGEELARKCLEEMREREWRRRKRSRAGKRRGESSSRAGGVRFEEIVEVGEWK